MRIKNNKGEFVGFVLLFVIILFAIMLLAPSQKGEFVKVDSFEIAGLKDSTTSSGDFFLGSGTLKGEMLLYYSKKTDNGGYKIEHIPASESTIYEIDKGPYYIEVYEQKVKYFWIFNRMKNYKYDIYIPKNSVKENFMVNLE